MATIEKRQLKDGSNRYDVVYRDPDRRLRKKTFAKLDAARAFQATVEADKLRGAYIDPNAGKVTFRTYADQWLAMQTFDRSTRDAVALRLRVHVYPVLGHRQLRAIKPSTIQSWLRGLDHLAGRTRRVILTNVSTILSAAVDDEVIAKNPCQARSVTKPKVIAKHVVPWAPDQVAAVRDALPARYQVLVTIGAGLGLRQGEAFGLSPNDVDFLRGIVTVRRQVKLYADGTQAFALPKGGKTRTVPLPGVVRDHLAAHLATWPATPVFLDGTEVPLVVTTRERTALVRNYFNRCVWKPALEAAGVEPSRENGMHALRHFFASVLLDSGESIKAVSDYLGHADPGFTLRTYTHLMPASDERTRRAIDTALDLGSCNSHVSPHRETAVNRGQRR